MWELCKRLLAKRFFLQMYGSQIPFSYLDSVWQQPKVTAPKKHKIEKEESSDDETTSSSSSDYSSSSDSESECEGPKVVPMSPFGNNVIVPNYANTSFSAMTNTAGPGRLFTPGVMQDKIGNDPTAPFNLVHPYPKGHYPTEMPKSQILLSGKDVVGTFTDPNTGIVYAALENSLPPKTIMAGDTPVFNPEGSARTLEFLTGISTLPQPCKRERENNFQDALDDANLPEAFKNEFTRRESAQRANRDLYFTQGEQPAQLLDVNWDGYIGDMYVMRPVYNMQSVADFDGGGTTNVNYIANASATEVFPYYGDSKQGFGGSMQTNVRILAKPKCVGHPNVVADALQQLNLNLMMVSDGIRGKGLEKVNPHGVNISVPVQADALPQFNDGIAVDYTVYDWQTKGVHTDVETNRFAGPVRDGVRGARMEETADPHPYISVEAGHSDSMPIYRLSESGRDAVVNQMPASITDTRLMSHHQSMPIINDSTHGVRNMIGAASTSGPVVEYGATHMPIHFETSVRDSVVNTMAPVISGPGTENPGRTPVMYSLHTPKADAAIFASTRTSDTGFEVASMLPSVNTLDTARDVIINPDVARVNVDTLQQNLPSVMTGDTGRDAQVVHHVSTSIDGFNVNLPSVQTRVTDAVSAPGRMVVESNSIGAFPFQFQAPNSAKVLNVPGDHFNQSVSIMNTEAAAFGDKNPFVFRPRATCGPGNNAALCSEVAQSSRPMYASPHILEAIMSNQLSVLEAKKREQHPNIMGAISLDVYDSC